MRKLYFLTYIFLVAFSLQAQDVIESDRNALIALYTATDGANWSNNTNWGTTELVSTWHGVTVTGDRVTEINLANNLLSGSIPSEIGNLSSLEYLFLNDNQLSGSIPLEIGALSSLKRLWLFNNQLSGTIPPEIGNLSSLSYLYLYNNQLSGSIPAEIGNLSFLADLLLYENQLDGPIPSEVGNLSYLRNLQLHDNQLSGSIPSAIGSLSFLGSFTIFNNQLSGPIPAEIGNLTILNSLDLSNNNLTGSIPNEIGALNNLKFLILNDNQLSGSIPSDIGDLTVLEDLNLSNNQLSGTIPNEIGNLTSLIFLRLNNNELNGSIPTEIENLSFLQSLVLDGNQLSGSLPDLSGLSSLTLVYLYNNYFSFEAIEAGYSYSFSNYDYNPQFDFPLNSNAVIAAIGDDVDINISNLATNNLGGSNNRYQWFKDDVSITPVTSSPVLSLTTIESDDYGTYTCKVTNTVITDLTLTSEEFILRANTAPIVVNSIADVEEIEGFGSLIIDLSNVFFDDDGDDLNYSAISDNTSVATVNISENFLNITEVGIGTTNISVTANDGYGGTVDELFLVSIQAEPQDVIQSDRDALMVLYNTTDGANWTNNTNWGSTEFVSSWYGITVDGDRVTGIELNDNQLSGSIPAEIGNLTNLEVLYLYNNQLNGSIPAEIGNLKSLSKFRLENNQLDGSIPVEIGNMTSLNSLQLSSNQLTGVIPSEIGNLTDLFYLYLDNNELHGSIPTEFENLISLNVLKLSNNQLSGSLPNLSGLTSLYWLSLQNNNFTFEAVEAGFSYSISTYDYNPQYDFPLNTDIVIAEISSDVDIDISSLSIYDLGGSNNLYQWFKDGVSISSISSSPVLSLTDIDTDDYGTYSCQVTNTVVTDLSLSSDEFILREDNADPIVANPIDDILENEGFGSLTIDLSTVFNDGDGDVLSYNVASDNTSAATANVYANTLTITEIGVGSARITVTASDNFGGEAKDEFTITINTTTSVQNIANLGIKLYPNPTKGIFYVENGNLAENLSLTIIDIRGKAVLHRNLEQSKTCIELNKDGKGLYFVLFKSDGKSFVSKIIIE